MQKVKCNNCNQDVYVMLYFYDAEITTHVGAANFGRYYEAKCKGKSVCPSCGSPIDHTFTKLISVESIIDLAGGRGNDDSY